MPPPESIEGFGTVDISVDMDGWSAAIPGGYRPAMAAFILPMMFLGAVIFGIGLLTSGTWLALLLSWMPLIFLYGMWVHGNRSATTTRLDVQHGDLRIQRRRFGIDRGDPIRLDLADVSVEITGGVGIQTMRIGGHTFPVHAAPDDLDAVTRLLRESIDLARQSDAVAPVPEQLRALLAAQRQVP